MALDLMVLGSQELVIQDRYLAFYGELLGRDRDQQPYQTALL